MTKVGPDLLESCGIRRKMSFDFEQAAKIKAVDFRNTLKEKLNGYLQINESATGN